MSDAAKKTTKAPAKTVAKAPARARKTARASKPPQPEPRKGTEG